MVMVIPSVFGVRDGTAVPDRSDGRSGLLLQPGPITQLGDGTCRLSMCAGRSRSTTSCNVTGLQVRPDLPALPNLFRTSNQAVDPSEKYQCTGAPVEGRRIATVDSMASNRLSEFLVVDDYGTGGIWFVVRAATEDDIRALLPNVLIYPTGLRPEWMSEEERADIGARRTLRPGPAPRFAMDDWTRRRAITVSIPAKLLSMSSPVWGSGVKTADTTMMSHSRSRGHALMKSRVS